MSTFLKSIEDYFGTSDLYEALGVEKTAKDSELRRAYHRLSLKVHPDRVSHDQVQEATEKFQVWLDTFFPSLSKCIAVIIYYHKMCSCLITNIAIYMCFFKI